MIFFLFFSRKKTVRKTVGNCKVTSSSIFSGETDLLLKTKCSDNVIFQSCRRQKASKQTTATKNADNIISWKSISNGSQPNVQLVF